MGRQKERDYRSRILTTLAQGAVIPTLGRNNLLRRWQEEGAGIPMEEFHELVWNLIRDGLIFLQPRCNNEKVITDFEMKLTTRGHQYLETAGEYEPDDPDGYLGQLRENMPDLDPIIQKYLQESLFAYRADCFLASAVMLGCASERAILLLGETYLESKHAKVSQPFREIFQSPKRKFGDKLEALRNQLEPIADQISVKPRRDIKAALDYMAEQIRQTRNQAGHPSGVELSRGQTRMNLHSAVYYMEVVYELIKYFGEPDGTAENF